MSIISIRVQAFEHLTILINTILMRGIVCIEKITTLLALKIQSNFHIKPRVRIDFPEFGFGSVLPLRGSDSDRFRRDGIGFGSVSPG
jgi:hypothetical protein